MTSRGTSNTPDCWAVPRLWPGKTVVCIAGGPSLDLSQVRLTAIARRQDRIRVIAVNDAVYPAWWADVLYACDHRWWVEHDGVPEFRGLKVTIDSARGHLNKYPEIKMVENTGSNGLELRPTGVRTGGNNGYQAINLAFHFGAKQIVLLGYDMKFGADGQAHWFGDLANWESKNRAVKNVFRPTFVGLAKEIRKANVEVTNATPGSGLDVFPKAALETVL